MFFFNLHAHIHHLRLVACPHEINRDDGKALLKDKNWTATNNPELVGGLEHFSFFHILGMSSSQLTKSNFSEGWLNHQSVVNLPKFARSLLTFL